MSEPSKLSAKFVARVPIRMSHLGGVVVSGRHIVAAPRVAGRLWGRFDGREREVALLDEQPIACQLDVDDSFRTCVCTTRSLAVYSADLSLLWRREASSPRACFWNGHLLLASSDAWMLLEPSSGAVLARSSTSLVRSTSSPIGRQGPPAWTGSSL